MEAAPLPEAFNLRLLWLTENYPPGKGGMAESCDRIVRSLRAAGVAVDLVHFRPAADSETVEVQSRGRGLVLPVGDDPAHALNCLWNRLSRDAAKTSYTHIVAFGGAMPLLAGPILSAWLKAPLVTLLRGNDFDVAIFSPRRDHILREALRCSGRVCVVSRDKEIKIALLHPTLRISWIPNGISLDDWEPLPSNLDKASQWKAQSVAPGKRVLGMFGQIKQKKGGLFFLQALLESGCADQFHLLFVGEVAAEITDWLKVSGTQICCSFHPFVSRYELLSFYPACDFVVIASFYDGLPNVLLEAAALGIPFIASTAGGMADFLVDGTHGYLFHPGDRHECALAITRAAAASEELCRAFQESSRLLARTKLDLRMEVESYLRVLLEPAFLSRPSGCDAALPEVPAMTVGERPAVLASDAG